HRHPAESVRFALVIQLLCERATKLRHHLDELELLTRGGVLIEKTSNVFHGREIGREAIADVRSLHFDSHRWTIAKCGAMTLAKRRRRHRLDLKGGKCLRDPNAEILLDDVL